MEHTERGKDRRRINNPPTGIIHYKLIIWIMKEGQDNTD